MAAPAGSLKPPLWRDVRVLRVAGQVAFVVVVVLIFREMYLNAAFQLAQRGDSLSYDFLDSRAGFGVKESFIDYSPNNSYWRVFWVAVTNALAVTFAGIILATILGILLGIARLSPNWLLRKLAQGYVEVIRNVPALVQIVFWYTAVILAIPRLEQSISIFDVALISNRGAAIPMMRGGEDFGLWGWCFLAAIITAVFVWRRRTKVFDDTGAPHYRFLWSSGTLVAIAAAAYLLVGDAFSIETPQIGLRNLEGGIQVSPEFAGVLLGLVIYTTAFIGEIVRGSILAVTKGQKEAAEALGLHPGQQLRYVVLPQAMRIALPSITNQYLNFWKNTSLGFFIAYPEIINVTTTMRNQAGHELEVFALLVAVYLSVSLLLSLLMNVLNRSVALKGGA